MTQSQIVKSQQNRLKEDNSDVKKSCLNFMSNIDPCERWSKEDTDKFFAGLQLFGTNFGMIETLFDGKRTRNQIKVSRRFLHVKIVTEKIQQRIEEKFSKVQPDA